MRVNELVQQVSTLEGPTAARRGEIAEMKSITEM
ncbi:DUF1515 family protein [Sinorhizobium fredii]